MKTWSSIRRLTVAAAAAPMVAVAALAALAVCVGPAQSAFPGANGRIAFVSFAEGPVEIYSINPDGTDYRRLTTSILAAGTRNSEPAWSPDGSKIAFARTEGTVNQPGFANVFVMNADGSGQTNLTNATTSVNTDPAWSPGGNAIAFVGDGDNGTADIFRMNADGSGRVNLTSTNDVWEVNPSWSPDGSRIAYDDGGSVWVMNADGTDPTNLTGSNLWSDRQPSWSPTGDQIAFTSDRDGPGNGEIYVMASDGSAVTRLTTHAEDDSLPQWSPDGTRIVFQSFRDGPPAGIYVLDPANPTNPPQRISTPFDGSATYPDWQPLAGSFGRLTVALRLVPATEPRFDLVLEGSLFVAAAGDGDSRTTTVAPGSYGLGPVPGLQNTLFDYFTSISCERNGGPQAATIEHGIVVHVGEGDHVVCTVTLVRIGHATNVVVAPVDATTGGTPLRVTYNDVTAGVTTLQTSSSGPPAPSGFEVAGLYYELATTATFDQAEVCFEIVPPSAPTIAHWAGSPPTLSTPATYYRDAAGTNVPAGFGEFACAIVSSFSPFALLEPEGPDEESEAPVISCGAADGVWHGANVSIACTAQDTGSGLADPAEAAFTLSTSVPAGTEDANAATGTREVCDQAGNCATAGPVAGNKVDRKAPALTLPPNKTVDATSPAGATVSYAASAADGADPSPAVSCAPASGSVFAIGTTTVACTATDHVANAANGSFAVTVRGAKEQLARLVNEVVAASALPAAVKAQLLARLQPLLAAFDPSNPAQRRAVCTGLNVFAAALRVLSGHGVPPAQAAAWIADATRIRAVLGC